jgi:hypothetical protein
VSQSGWAQAIAPAPNGEEMAMRPLWRALSRYRPRALTLLLLAIISALLVLSNLSDELARRRIATQPPASSANGNAPELAFDLWEPAGDAPRFSLNLSYGWPLLWRQYVIGGYPYSVRGKCLSTGRLLGNVAMWLILLAAPAAICEWLLRHYQWRLSWSLRFMLAAIGLIAACCGWFVSFPRTQRRSPRLSKQCNAAARPAARRPRSNGGRYGVFREWVRIRTAAVVVAQR